MAEALGPAGGRPPPARRIPGAGQGGRALRPALPRLCRHAEPPPGARAAPGPDRVRQCQPGTQPKRRPAAKRASPRDQAQAGPGRGRARAGARSARGWTRCASDPDEAGREPARRRREGTPPRAGRRCRRSRDRGQPRPAAAGSAARRGDRRSRAARDASRADAAWPSRDEGADTRRCGRRRRRVSRDNPLAALDAARAGRARAHASSTRRAPALRSHGRTAGASRSRCCAAATAKSERADALQAQRRQARDERQDECRYRRQNAASEADAEVEQQGQALVEGWTQPLRRPGAACSLDDGRRRWQPCTIGCCCGARQRQSRPAGPAGSAAASQPSAGGSVACALDGQRRRCKRSVQSRRRARTPEAGRDAAPPLPYTRAADSREQPCRRAAVAARRFP